MPERKRIWRDDWSDTRQPHDPERWRRSDGRGFVNLFGQYSEKSMRKWMALRGHAYDFWLHNGQRVTVRPRVK